jgi:hypothetical protein
MALIHGIAIKHLRPTQITVGMVEVHEKRHHLKGIREHEKKLEDFLADHPIPVVHGANDKFYIIDHHHLGRALWEAEIDGASLDPVADLSKLDERAFWHEMSAQHWVHPYDENGHQQEYDAIPHHVSSLRDDPYRSLAAYVRYAGGYEKSQKPFAEFVWADYFRPRIKPELVSKDFDKALKHALDLAGHHDCAKMPGFIHESVRSK